MKQHHKCLLKRIISSIITFYILIIPFPIYSDANHNNYGAFTEEVGATAYTELWKDGDTISPSGDDFSTRVSYEINPIYSNYDNDQTAFITFYLNTLKEIPVSFEYEIYPGSAFLIDHFNGELSGTIIFEPGSTEKSIEIEIPKLVHTPSLPSKVGEFWTKDRIFYINCFSLENALFENEKNSTTIPVVIKNEFDFEKSYERAKNTYIVDLTQLDLGSVEVFQDTPGKYRNLLETVGLAIESTISKDVRTMIDNNVFTHLTSPRGYFLNESTVTGAVYFNIESNHTWGINYFERTIPIDGSDEIDFNIGEIQLSEIGLGPNMEGNGIIQSLNVSYRYSVDENIYTIFESLEGEGFENQINFVDKIKPYPTEIEVQEGCFSVGHSVPIIVTYNEPVYIDSISITVNDEILYPMESNETISETVSFLYDLSLDDFFLESNRVKAKIEVSNIIGAVDLSKQSQDNDYSITYSRDMVDKSIEEYDDIKSIFSYAADTVISLTRDGNTAINGEVVISLEESHILTQYLESYIGADGVVENIGVKVIGNLGEPVDVSLYANEGHIITELKGTFQSPINTTDMDKYCIAEVYFSDELIYSLAKKYTVASLVYIDDDGDFEIIYEEWPSSGKITANSEMSLVLGYRVDTNATWQDSKDFSWSSSDETVASIKGDGTIILTGKLGEVRFTLTALNGGVEGKSYQIHSKPLTVINSSEGFLLVPNGVKNIELVEGNSARIYYSTNITEINASNGGPETPTTYTFELYEAVHDGSSEPEKGGLIYKDYVDATIDNLITSYILNSEYLVNTAPLGRYSYILEISTKDILTGELFSARANIRVKSRPAKAVLIKPDSYYMTDQVEGFTVSFNIENKNEATAVSLQLFRNGEPIHIDDAVEKFETRINIREVDRSRLYDAYTVTLKAKNQYDEAYSYDSYIFYVYNSEALKILINNINSGENYTLSLDHMSGMTSKDILDLKREINLEERLTINKDEYNWSKIYDKILWTVEDGSKVSLKYNDNGIYRDIDEEELILPNGDLMLKGVSSGETSISAIHVLTGMEESLEITVDSVKDKLFIFQCYPGKKSLVQYINGDGISKEVYTDEKGSLAIYEKSGITGDMKFSIPNDALYEPYILSENERSVNQVSIDYTGLYPQKNIIFNQSNYGLNFAVFAEYEKGITSYKGAIEVKGGVYINGVYRPEILINGLSGKEYQSINPKAYDFYELNFNFPKGEEGFYLKPEDKIEYIIEVSIPGNTHYHEFIKVDNETIGLYKRIKNGITYVEAPILSMVDSSNLQNDAKVFWNSLSIDGVDYQFLDLIIIEDTEKESLLNTQIVLDGKFTDAYEVKYSDERGRDWSLFSSTSVESYEFSDYVILNNTFDLKKYIFYFKPGEESRLSRQIVIKNNSNLKIINMPTTFKVINIQDIPSMGTLVKGDMEDISENILDSVLGSNTVPWGDKPDYVRDVLNTLSQFKIDKEAIRLVVSPTDDPMVFRGIMKISIGDLSESNPAGVYASDLDSSTKFNFLPKIGEAKEMKKGDYISKSIKTMEQYKTGSVSKKTKQYGGGIYIDCEIFYDANSEEWRISVINSDVYVAGGYNYKKTYNTWVSFIPVTAEFMIGGTAQISLKTLLEKKEISKEEYEFYRTYITELYPYFFIRGFGGIGLDYDVVSLKAGPYGRINFEQRYLWLNNKFEDSNGQRLTLSGQTGIEYKIKLLFLGLEGSYTIGEASKSWTYNDYNNIKEKYDSVYQIDKADLIRIKNHMYLEDEVLIPTDITVTYEGREYLENHREWYPPIMSRGFFHGASTEALSVIQTNAYPYSNPVVTEDGEIMLYISDMDSYDINDTAVNFSTKEEGYFSEGTEVDESNYADTDAVVDGTSEWAVAAWIRLIEDIESSEGEEAELWDIQRMMNSTEIMASIYDGEEFVATRLTNNYTPDMSPVVASREGKAIVAWRSLYAGDIEKPLTFDGRNNIMYKVYNEGSWSDEKCLFDGSVDQVISVNAEMLSDGTSAITYEVQMDATENTEIYCAIVDIHGHIIRNIRLTNNEVTDKNPRITSVVFPDKTERFVIGWNSKMTYDVENVNLIRVSAVDRVGNVFTEFEQDIESGELLDYTSFKFTKGAESIDDLSIVWYQPDFKEDGVYSVWGRKFISRNNDEFKASPEVRLLELNYNTVVDFFDSYIDKDTKGINFVMQTTEYGMGKISQLITAKASYKNNLILDETYYSRDELISGLDVPVMFRIYNEGVDTVKKINIEIGESSRTFEENNLIEPGQYKEFVLLYRVPDVIENPIYTIRAEYTDSLDVLTGELDMNIPDVGIHGISLVRESNRQRIFDIELYNSMYAKLRSGVHKVLLEVYHTSNFDNPPILSETISDLDSLELMNQGILKKNMILGEDDLQRILNENGEIPEEGVRIFFKVKLLENNIEIQDADISNDYDYIKIESLIVKNGKKLSLGSSMNSDSNKTLIKVEAFNNSMNEITNGNIVVHLKDEKGNIIQTKEYYNEAQSIKTPLSIGGEESNTVVFNFAYSGDSFEVIYRDIITDPNEGDEPNDEDDNGNGGIGDNSGDKDSGKEVTPAEYVNPFKDVKETDWFYEAVKFVFENGLMIGIGEDRFAPQLATTRGMLVTILHRLEGEPAAGLNSFEDVLPDEYYYNAVAWAKEKGIVYGISESFFGANKEITREQFVTILYRYASFKGYDVSSPIELSEYVDMVSISEYAVPAMRWAVQNGLIRGVGGSTLAPLKSTSRAEMAMILQRFILAYNHLFLEE
ncbi:S-layer homology domain-containing protein [Proteiniborus ethanoligenes]|uniref:S-layer homology domain-containing protein n=1 Tax=Proteiniborus ethanoligenes TaxID=415015 RepID=A0A1H3QF44_9FIRM|nr:S-layer homology domain-containing protein [Proteiniborus ethanoligenes]SDZ11977.1 S-layer homology domain-containing protein [Proteiniborus ethanoligenes]